MSRSRVSMRSGEPSATRDPSARRLLLLLLRDGMFPDEALRASDRRRRTKQFFLLFSSRYSCVPHSTLGGAGVRSMSRRPFHCNFSFIEISFKKLIKSTAFQRPQGVKHSSSHLIINTIIPLENFYANQLAFGF